MVAGAAVLGFLAGCSGGGVELVRSTLAGAEHTSPIDIEVVGHRSAGLGRALAYASLGDPLVTVVATTVGVYAVDAADPTSAPIALDRFDALATPVDVALTPDARLAAVALSSPPSVRWYDLTANPPTQLATAELPDDPPVAITFSANGVLIGQTGSSILSWPGGPASEPSRFDQDGAALGRAALLPSNRVVVPVAGTAGVLIGPIEGPLRHETAPWADGGTLADAQATAGGTLAFSVIRNDDSVAGGGEIVVVDIERWDAIGRAPTDTVVPPNGWAVSDTHIGVVGADGPWAYRLDGSPVAPLTLPNGRASDLSGHATTVLGTSVGFVTIEAGGSVAFWNGAYLSDPHIAESPPGARSIERMGDTVGIVGNTGEFAVWNAMTGAAVLTEQRFAVGEFTGVAAVPGGRIAVGSTAGKAFLFDADLTPSGEIDEAGRQVDAVAFVPGTGDLVTARAARLGQFVFDDTITRWNVGDTAPTFQVGGEAEDVEGCAFFFNRLRFSADGSQVAAIRHTFEVQLIDLATGDVRHTFPPHLNTVLDVAFTDDGHLVTAAEDATVRVWNLNDYSLAAEYRAMAGGYQTVLPLGDGTMAISDIVGSMAIVEVMTGDVMSRMPDATYRTARLALSPDRTLIAVPTPDAGITLWSVDEAQPVTTLFGPNRPVSDVTFADPTTVVAASTDGTVHRWTLSPP